MVLELLDEPNFAPFTLTKQLFILKSKKHLYSICQMDVMMLRDSRGSSSLNGWKQDVKGKVCD